jgi:hypothetical protein
VCLYMYIYGQPGSSVIIVSGYGLDDWAIEAEAKTQPGCDADHSP